MPAVAYTDPTKLMRAFPNARPGPDNEVDPDLILSAIAQASSEVDAYLAGVYVLPITVEVPLLTRITTDIALYFIFTAEPFTAPPRNVETAWPARYNAAIALLQKIQAGEIALVDVTGVIVDSGGSTGQAWSSTQNYVPTFGEADERGFRVDPEKIAAETSRRWP